MQRTRALRNNKPAAGLQLISKSTADDRFTLNVTVEDYPPLRLKENIEGLQVSYTCAGGQRVAYEVLPLNRSSARECVVFYLFDERLFRSQLLSCSASTRRAPSPGATFTQLFTLSPIRLSASVAAST